jgi:hypothetical protein
MNAKYFAEIKIAINVSDKKNYEATEIPQFYFSG